MSSSLQFARRSVLSGLCAVALACALPAFAQTINMKAAHSAALDEPYQVGMADFAKRITAATGGKVNVAIFANNQLGNERELIEGLPLGLVDIACPANAVLTNFIPDLVTLDLPFLFHDQAHLERLLNGPLIDVVSEAAAKRGYRVLGLYTAGVRHIMTKKTINTVADLKGLKIRTMQNPAHVEAFKALGANPTPLAYGELYGALQSGVVDGAEAANTNYHAQKFFEVAPNWAMVSWTVLISPLIMSEAKFKSYPADVQAALLKAGRESAVVERAEYARSDTERLEALKKTGVKITTPDPAGFRTAVTKVYGDFVKNDTQKKILEVIQTTK
jgi:tripartite ATP-independent transporter DctP family solute receptor